MQSLGKENGHVEVSLTWDLRNAMFSRTDLSGKKKNSFVFFMSPNDREH